MIPLSAKEEAGISGYGGEDLLVVGPGVLGGLVGKLYKERHFEAKVVGQTNSEANHDRLRQLGLLPRLKQAASSESFPNVVFSAPPSGSTDYVGEVENAIKLWNGAGVFVFTSSTGVFDSKNVDVITEETPILGLGTSDRIDRLLKAEQAVLDAGGCVLRLVGLYHTNRGAHTFFLRQGEVQRAGNHVVNLIHYEDAAGLLLKILDADKEDGKFRGKCLLGTDSSPITFQEMMEATLSSGKFSGTVKFTAPAEEKQAPSSSNPETRRLLDWAPKYSSFAKFMRSGAADFYSQA